MQWRQILAERTDILETILFTFLLKKNMVKDLEPTEFFAYHLNFQW